MAYKGIKGNVKALLICYIEKLKANTIIGCLDNLYCVLTKQTF